MKDSLKKTLTKALQRLYATPIIAYGKYTTTSASTDTYGAYRWSKNISKAGYTPIAFSLQYANSATTDIGAEEFSKTTISGFCSWANFTIIIYVVYVKD